MVLVELNNLSYRYGTSLYAVDRVNGIMYGKFSVGLQNDTRKGYGYTSIPTHFCGG